MSRLQHPTEKQQAGQIGEEAALAYLLGQGLTLVERNYRCRQGEIDLIMRHHGTLVFIEVRKRKKQAFGGAIASVTKAKQKRLIHAAHSFLQRFQQSPECRFDMIAIDGEELAWLQNVIETV